MSSEPLLYVFFGLISFATCSLRRNQEFCADVNGNKICYIRGSAKKSIWSKGYQSCRRKNFTLPIIRSVEEMSTLKAYIDHLKVRKFDISSLWLSGKWDSFENWTWIDGQAFNQNGKCDDDESIQTPTSCLIKSEVKKSWYEAREHCVDERGDLAVVMDPNLLIVDDLDDPGDYSGWNEDGAYWIGLRKGAWFWKSDSRDSEEVKFYSWETRVKRPMYAQNHGYDSREQLCISSNGPTGEWRISLCNETHWVICQRRAAEIKTDDITNEQDQTSKNAFMLSTIITAALLIVAAIVIVAIIVQKKASDSKRKSSCERQYQNFPAVRADNDRERNDHYEAIELKDNVYQVIRISDLATEPDSSEGRSAELENATGSAPESQGEQSHKRHCQDAQNVYSDPDPELGDQYDAIEERKDCQ